MTCRGVGRLRAGHTRRVQAPRPAARRARAPGCGPPRASAPTEGDGNTCTGDRKGRNYGEASRCPPQTKTEVPRETSVLERKKEPGDMQLSRLLRKPRKRNDPGSIVFVPSGQNPAKRFWPEKEPPHPRNEASALRFGKENERHRSINRSRKPKRKSPVRLPFWKGRRSREICSFRGSYGNRGSGMIPASFLPRPQNEAPRFVLERKKEAADMELSRLFRKPGKRNGAAFF